MGMYQVGPSFGLERRPKYLRKYVCSSLAVVRQRVHDSSAETNNDELLIDRQRFRDNDYIDGNNWLRDL
jgi:hypothetical protein